MNTSARQGKPATSNGSAAEPWLPRKACDDDHLDGYYAYTVACAAPIHRAIAAPDTDEALPALTLENCP